MTGSPRKRKNTRKNLWMPVAVILSLVLAALIAVFLIKTIAEKNKEASTAAPEESTAPGTSSPFPTTAESIFPADLGNDITLKEITSYAGIFVEDGSDKIVSGIPVITLENNGTDAVQLMELVLKTEKGETYEFSITTLLPGEKLEALESHGKVYDATDRIISAERTLYACFTEAPSLHEELLKIEGKNNGISVANISDKTFAGGKLFYKNLSGDVLMGGITYAVNIPALNAGQQMTLAAGHFHSESSRIIFVTYAEP